jgi:hypothetical protein
MVNWLSTEAVAKESAPYSWTLKGNFWDVDDLTAAPWQAESDGYELIATLGWVRMTDEDAEAAGTSGACVEALN